MRLMCSKEGTGGGIICEGLEQIHVCVIDIRNILAYYR
jgi:hypothetical protein